jgi:hypothetical protein
MRQRLKSIFRLSFTAALWLPMATTLALLYSFYLRAWVSLGHPPTYGQPDPKWMGFTLHYEVVFASLAFLYISMATLSIYGLYFLAFRRGIAGVRPRYFVLGAALLVIFILTIGSELGNWFLD